MSLVGGSVCVAAATAASRVPILISAPSSPAPHSYEGYVLVLAPSGASLFVGLNDYVQGTALASQTFAVAASLEWQQVRGAYRGRIMSRASPRLRLSNRATKLPPADAPSATLLRHPCRSASR